MNTKLIFIFFVALFSFNEVIAQEETKKKEAETEEKNSDDWFSYLKNSDFSFKRQKSKFHGHWAGFEVGINALRTVNNDIELNEDENSFLETRHLKSWHFAVNPLRFSIPLSKPNFGLVTGIGVAWNNYGFANKFNFKEVDGKMVPEEVTDKDIYHNRLNTIYVNVPLLIELQFPRYGRNRFHLGVGAMAGVRVLSKQTQRWHDENDVLHRHSQFGGLNINQFRYGLAARLGYGYVHLFMNYSLSELFEPGKGPELYPFSVGIVIISL